MALSFKKQDVAGHSRPLNSPDTLVYRKAAEGVNRANGLFIALASLMVSSGELARDELLTI